MVPPICLRGCVMIDRLLVQIFLHDLIMATVVLRDSKWSSEFSEMHGNVGTFSQHVNSSSGNPKYRVVIEIGTMRRE